MTRISKRARLRMKILKWLGIVTCVSLLLTGCEGYKRIEDVSVVEVETKYTCSVKNICRKSVITFEKPTGGKFKLKTTQNYEELLIIGQVLDVTYSSDMFIQKIFLDGE